MVSKTEFWQIFTGYGQGITPFQYLFYFAALFLVIRLFIRPGKLQNVLVKVFLSICFAWNAVFFYLLYAAGLSGDSSANIMFAVLFLLVAALFLLDVFRGKMEFSLPIGWRRSGTLVFTVLVFCYPLFSFLLGHPLAGLVFPGTYPCPTTALALLLLTTSLPRVDMAIYGILLLCAIPFTPFIQIARYGVYEDVILLAAGIYSLVLLIRLKCSRQ
jgi:hypothetical protein